MEWGRNYPVLRVGGSLQSGLEVDISGYEKGSKNIKEEREQDG